VELVETISVLDRVIRIMSAVLPPDTFMYIQDPSLQRVGDVENNNVPSAHASIVTEVFILYMQKVVGYT